MRCHMCAGERNLSELTQVSRKIREWRREEHCIVTDFLCDECVRFYAWKCDDCGVTRDRASLPPYWNLYGKDWCGKCLGDDWRRGEILRFRCLEYAPVSWERETWWQEHHTRLHFAHVSRRDAALIAYAPTAKYGESDRHTQMKPGKYLAKYHSDISESLRETLVSEWKAKYEVEVQFAHTPDECSDVYRFGPRSCMCSKDHSHLENLPTYPTAIYGAGDLAVAFLGDISSASARSVVWPSRKIYGRVYGDNQTLSRALERLGYESGDGSEWNGAKLLREPYGNGFIFPYLDICAGASDGGDFLILDDDSPEISGSSTSGHAGCARCFCCGDGVSPDDENYCQGEIICGDCFSSETLYCGSCGETHWIENSAEVHSDGRYEYWCEECLSRAWGCDSCGEYYDSSVPPVERNNCYYCQECDPGCSCRDPECEECECEDCWNSLAECECEPPVNSEREMRE